MIFQISFLIDFKSAKICIYETPYFATWHKVYATSE